MSAIKRLAELVTLAVLLLSIQIGLEVLVIAFDIQ